LVGFLVFFLQCLMVLFFLFYWYFFWIKLTYCK
jgi:hypothetical protein